jgi:hypothetical protein
LFRIYWSDPTEDEIVNVGDEFRVTGDDVPLPSGRSFSMYLYWADSSLINAANWKT